MAAPTLVPLARIWGRPRRAAPTDIPLVLGKSLIRATRSRLRFVVFCSRNLIDSQKSNTHSFSKKTRRSLGLVIRAVARKAVGFPQGRRRSRGGISNLGLRISKLKQRRHYFFMPSLGARRSSHRFARMNADGRNFHVTANRLLRSTHCLLVTATRPAICRGITGSLGLGEWC